MKNNGTEWTEPGKAGYQVMRQFGDLVARMWVGSSLAAAEIQQERLYREYPDDDFVIEAIPGKPAWSPILKCGCEWRELVPCERHGTPKQKETTR